MEIKKPKPDMTKEELFTYLWQLAEAIEFELNDLKRKVEQNEEE